MNEVAEKALSLINSSTNIALEEYTKWMIRSSLIELLVSIVLMTAAWKVYRWLKNLDECDSDYEFKAPLSVVLIALIVLVGGIAFMDASTTLCNPKAAAIHRLLEDLRIGK